MKKIVKTLLALPLIIMMLFNLIGCSEGLLCCFEGANVIYWHQQERYEWLPHEQTRENLAIAMALDRSQTPRYEAMDEFAGVWFCRYGHLNIALTKSIPAGSQIRRIVYHEHRFTYKFLSEVHEAVVQIAQYYSVSGIGVRVMNNVLEVGLLSSGTQACSDIRYIVAHLQSLNLWERDAVLFVLDSPPIVIGLPN